MADSLSELHSHGAACGPENGDLFSPEATPIMQHKAKLICQGCPVRARCLKWAIEHEEWGTWGGEFFRGQSKVTPVPELRDTARNLFAEGKTNREVAGLLGISVQTAIGFHSAWKRDRRRREQSLVRSA